MANNDYKINKKGMEAFIKSQVVGNAVKSQADRALQYARSIAPVRSGRYRDSLHTEQVGVSAGRKSEKRAGALLSTDSPYGAVVENKHKILSRTADHMRGGSR